MRALIRRGTARGVVEAPPSKSAAHRLLVCAGLSRGVSEIRRVAPSDDILATIDGLRALGAQVTWHGDAVSVKGCSPKNAPPARLDCRESGSTLRFLIPLCLLSGNPMRLTGSEALLARPLSLYQTLCAERGLTFELDGRELCVRGPLHSGAWALSGAVSSQFVSGLLFALPLLDGDSEITLLPPVESRPYIDMTVRALRAFGVDVRWLDARTLRVPGHSDYQPRVCAVEGDWSNAAFFAALNLFGGDVRVTGLRGDSPQGDRVFPEYFDRLARGHAVLDVSDCPDLAPALMAVASLKHGCVLTGTRRLKYKESDRGNAMAAELAKCGAKAVVAENEIAVRPVSLHAPAEALNSHNDHRVAMALSLVCACLGGTIDGAEAVSKSCPDYWERLRGLGIDVELTE